MILRIAALETRSHSAVSMGGSNELVECFCGGVVAEGYSRRKCLGLVSILD